MAKFELPEGLSPEALALIVKSFKELNVAATDVAKHLSSMNEDAIALANNVSKVNVKLGEQREVIEGAAYIFLVPTLCSPVGKVILPGPNLNLLASA